MLTSASIIYWLGVVAYIDLPVHACCQVFNIEISSVRPKMVFSRNRTSAVLSVPAETETEPFALKQTRACDHVYLNTLNFV